MTLSLTVEPVDGIIDELRRIRVTGAKPNSLVTLDARTERGGGQVWHSQATFYADAEGSIDLGRDAPVGGDYAAISAMGLLWAQHPEGGPAGGLFSDDVMVPLTTALVAADQYGNGAKASLVQRFAAEGVTRSEVREDGLVGTVFTPAGAGPHPAVVVLNGSTGGINEARAALYASHGYAAFALGYFKAPGLSPYITGTPLEYFENGLRWAHGALAPRDGFLAISGQSRGGELVLLLAATFPDVVSAIIAYVPGAYVHGAQGAGDPERGGWKGITWTHGGKALDHLWDDNKGVTWHPWNGAAPPTRHDSVYWDGFRDTDLAERSRIRIENFNGPILLISGRDDRAWPSSLYSRMVVSTIAAKPADQFVRHLDYDDAGHSINFPFVPTTQLERLHPVSKVPFTSGGTPSGNARADEGSWAGVLNFLSTATKRA